MESNKLTTTSATKFNDGVINYRLIEDIYHEATSACSQGRNHCRRLSGRDGLGEHGAGIAAPRSDHRETEPEKGEAGNHQVTAPALELGLAEGKPRCRERRACAERDGNDAEDQKHGRLRLRSQPLCYPTRR